MISKVNEYKKRAAWLYRKGFVHIMGSGFVSKLLTFLGNVFVVRFLTKSQYGTFGYIDNIMGFFLIVSGLGMTGGILQFCSESRSESQKNAYYRFGLQFGIVVNIILCIIIFIVALYAPFTIAQSRKYLMLYSLYPLTYYMFQYFCIILRCKRENKKYAALININAAIYAAGEVIGTYYIGISGIIFALYCATAIVSVIGFLLLSKNCFFSKIKLSLESKREIVSYAIYTCINTSISNLLILFDVFLIGILVADPQSIASYKVATIIPLALIFIPNSVIMFVYPYFAEHNHDYEWFMENAKKLFKITAIMNFLVSVLLVIFAPFIIKVLWGVKYLTAVTSFRILSINYFISATFRVNSSNLLASLKRVKANLYVNIVSGVANILLDYLFIQRWGADGAAWATLAVVSITSVLLIPTLRHYILRLKKDNN